jgi:hypothetical protein
MDMSSLAPVKCFIKYGKKLYRAHYLSEIIEATGFGAKRIYRAIKALQRAGYFFIQPEKGGGDYTHQSLSSISLYICPKFFIDLGISETKLNNCRHHANQSECCVKKEQTKEIIERKELEPARSNYTKAVGISVIANLKKMLSFSSPKLE